MQLVGLWFLSFVYDALTTALQHIKVSSAGGTVFIKSAEKALILST